MTGCSKDEIEHIEDVFGMALPTVYRHWLSTYGREPPSRFVGSDCSFPVVLQLRDWAKELLKDCSLTLGASDFVFFMHQGYHFLYFKADESSDDPVVYEYLEGWLEPKMRPERLSNWLNGA